MSELSPENRQVGIEEARADFEQLQAVTKTLEAVQLIKEADGNEPLPKLTDVDFLVRVFRIMKVLEEADGRRPRE